MNLLLASSLVALASFTLLLAGCSDPPAPTAPSSASSAVDTTPSAPPSPPATTPAAVLPPPPAAPAAGDAAASAIDSPATDPKGTLSKAEESKSMPMAGHGNNHSSPSLDTAPKN